MATDDREWIEAIAADPYNNTLRLAYADWLEEQADARCEFVRYEVAMRTKENVPVLEAAADEVAPSHDGGRTRYFAARAQCDSDWLAEISLGVVLHCGEIETTPDTIGQARIAVESPGPHVGDDCPKKWERLRRTDDPRCRMCPVCRVGVIWHREYQEAELAIRSDEPGGPPRATAIDRIPLLLDFTAMSAAPRQLLRPVVDAITAAAIHIRNAWRQEREDG